MAFQDTHFLTGIGVEDGPAPAVRVEERRGDVDEAVEARAEAPARRQHGDEGGGVRALPALLLHPDERVGGGLGEAVARVAGDERVPGDAVPGGHAVEHPARVRGAAAPGVHGGEGRGGVRLAGEPPRGELRVHGAAGGQVPPRGAELVERGVGAEEGEGKWRRTWR
jgi:hypothetical protein